ncbi:hypothetical protein ABT390_33870 [Streptomyces aurantiacus]|uniref:Uncharacterized protein n=1 Tax=Streptomyces aurantiacus JA 4570 TaxID=1286094 RepID=S3ZVU5_9ACTN|nr:hypothetical protein [Streptomyces aurantiacus]EPH46894.1 hypothetical protein STRAU_0060 [Streptomyces aurantiacus JA 4570]
MKKPHPLWSDPQRAEELKKELDALHRWKIRTADQVLVVNPGGYIGESTHAEIRFAHQLGRPIRYTHPPGHAVVLTRPGLDPVRLGPYTSRHQTDEAAARLRRQLYCTQHVEGTTIHVADYRPELEHLDPRVPTDPYALADAMAEEQAADGTGRNFPDLYTLLIAHAGDTRAADLWNRACHLYDFLHGSDADQYEAGL